MGEQLLSVGIDIGTSTTQLILSRLTLENRATPFTVPRVSIAGREVLYRSAIHFTPLLSDTVIDAAGSILTTAMPLAQELIIVRRADRPCMLAP